MGENVLPCFICGKVLRPIFPGSSDPEQQADDACYFRSQGQYGSTVFDPMDGTYLEINICDECLRAHPERVLHCRKAIRPPRRSQIWALLNREEDDE